MHELGSEGETESIISSSQAVEEYKRFHDTNDSNDSKGVCGEPGLILKGDKEITWIGKNTRTMR